ncbi:MAG: hypothetical protein ABSA85_10715 [Terracidiphilus sp.]
MRTTFGFAILFFLSLCVASSATQPQTTRKTLHQPTLIQGIPCAKDYTWFFASGQLEKCTVTREMPFGEITIPAGSWITLTKDGKPNIVQMPHDAPVLGLECQGGGLLGTGEGPVVALYPSGKLKVCFLASDQAVQGVPCSHGGFFSTLSGPDPGVYLYESGKLRQCRLTADFGGKRKSELFKQAP